MDFDLSNLPDQSPGMDLENLPDQTSPEVSRSLADAVKKKPEQHSKIRDLSKQSGMQPVVVERNLDKVEQRAKVNKINEAAKNSPGFSRSLEDPNFAKASHEETDNYIRLEKVMEESGWFGTIGKSVQNLPYQLAGAVTGWLEGAGELKEGRREEIMGALEDIQLDPPDKDVGILEKMRAGVGRGEAENRLFKALATREVGEEVGDLIRDEKYGAALFALKEGAYDEEEDPVNKVITELGASGSEHWAKKVAENQPVTYPWTPKWVASQTIQGVIPSLALGTAAAYMTKGKSIPQSAASLSAMFTYVYGKTYGESRLEGYSIKESQGKAAFYATTEAVSEMVPLGILTKTGGKWYYKLAKVGPAESIQEVVNEAMQIAYDYGVLDEETPPEQVFERLKTAGVIGFFGGEAVGIATLPLSFEDKAEKSIIDATGPSSQLSKDAVKAQAAFDNSDQTAKVVEAAMEIKGRDHSPDAVKKFVENVVGAEEEIYIPAEDANKLFQSHPEILEKMPEEVAESIEEALATKGDVAVTKSNYLTYLSEFHEEIANSIRNDIDGMNAAEAEEWTETAKDQMDADAAKILEGMEEDQDFIDSANRVEQFIVNDLNKAGRFDARTNAIKASMTKNFFIAMAKKLNQTPEQVYKDIGLRVQGAPVVGEAFDEQAVRKEAEVTLKKTLQAVPTEQEVTEYLEQARAEHAAAEQENIARHARVMAGEVWDQGAVPEIGRTLGNQNASITIPTVEEITQVLTDHPLVKLTGQIKNAYVVGSFAEGDPNDLSDVDVLLEVNKRRGYTAEELEEKYRDKLRKYFMEKDIKERRDDLHPQWDGRRVDIYFTYSAEEETRPKVKMPKAGDALYQAPVDTEAFKSWFGESKVVDEKGEPLVAYHGTAEEFEAFDPDRAIGGQHWFTTDKAGIEKGEVGAAGRGVIVEAYLSLQNPAGWDEYHNLALDELIARGYDGLALKDGDETTYVAFEPEQIKSVKNLGAFDPADPRILYQKDKAPRAQIQFGEGEAIITLLEGADLSSWLHESGHLFFEAYKNLAPKSPEIAKDMQALLDFVGVDSMETWNGMTLEERREGHETVARAFEAYLFEGKSPSLEMESLFQTFRSWLIEVYKNLVNLNVKLTDEVRGVFDRMLATEEQIQAKKNMNEYSALFASAEEAMENGMTTKQWQDYQNLDQSRVAVAGSELMTRSLKDMKWLANAKSRELKRLQKEAKEKRKTMRLEVANEVANEPVYVTTKFLKTGEAYNTDGELVKMENHKISLDEFKERYPNVHAPRGMTKKDGIPMDVAAKLLGYSSGEVMMNDVLNAEPQKEKIERVTDQRMLVAYGDISSPEAFEAAATEALHNEAHTRFLHTELRALTKGVGTRNVLARAAKQYAEMSMARKKIKDIRPGQYSAAERRAAKNAEKALVKGDREAAAEHKRAQVLSNHFFRAATKAKIDTEKMLRFLKKFTKKGARKNIDPEYLEQIDAMLEQYDLKQGVSQKEIAARKGLADWIATQEDRGFEPIVDEALLEASKKKHFKEMTVEEMSGLTDSVKNIEHLGRLKTKLLRQKDQREFNAHMDEARASLEENANRTVEERGTPTDVLGYLGTWSRQILAIHRKFASFVREMDGGKNNGKMFQLLTEGMSQSGDNETEMTRHDTEALHEIFQTVMHDIHTGGIPLNISSQRYAIPGTDLSMTKEEMLMFGINWGNEGNRQRLMDGGLTGKKALSQPEANAILDMLDKKDWDFVQAILDHIGAKKVLIGEQEKRLTGVTPKWIDAAPIETKYGTYPGGYFPAKYDAMLSTRSEALEAVNDLRQAMRGAFGSSTTRSSYAKQRAKEVHGRPILLNFNAISQHINEVNHRLSWQDWVTDANRILKSLDEPIRRHYGPEVLKELRDTVKDIASGDAQTTHAWETAVNRLRVGATIVGMGWRFTTAIIQPTGLAQSWARVGSKYMIKGIARTTANPVEALRVAIEKSKMMKDRSVTMQREINEVLNNVKTGDGIGKFKVSMFWLIQKMQMTVDVPTWWASYEQALDELQLETAQTQEQRDAIEERAISIANQTVKDTQSSGMIQDLAKIQRGNPMFKLFTNFYSYFSATYNLNVEAYRKTSFKSPSEVAMMLSDMVIINVMPALFGAALRELLKNECEGEMECLMEKYAEEQVSFILAMTIPSREMGAGLGALVGLETFDYKGPAGLRPFADIYSLQVQTSQGEMDKAWMKAANKVAGSILHYPAGQINQTVEGMMAIESGEVEGAGAVRALLTGPPRK